MVEVPERGGEGARGRFGVREVEWPPPRPLPPKPPLPRPPPKPMTVAVTVAVAVTVTVKSEVNREERRGEERRGENRERGYIYNIIYVESLESGV